MMLGRSSVLAGSLRRTVKNTTSIRFFSASADSAWTEKWTAATAATNTGDMTFDNSAARLRALTQTNLLKATDLRDAPERFFEAHRILARHAVKDGPGFWIRFTVHYNLCAGTVLAVGSDEQVESLTKFQEEGKLGCFSLTEKLAGVQSGLVVQTTADWDEASQEFILHTPNVGARKNWISQGFTADKTVVVATLRMNGETKGPQAFYMDLRKDGALVDGVSVDDMGKKTTGNDLDNAWISFDNVRLPATALLSRYGEIKDNEYVIKTKGVRPFDMIGQRLYTGRIAVAQAALEYRRQLFKQTKEYSDNKHTFAFKGEPVLSNIPQLAAIYQENTAQMVKLDGFVGDCEAALNACLKNGGAPSNKLVDAIATCKVRAVETSIAMCFKLKQEVGSFALMDDAGFKHMDFLQCCKFAEGDSRILMTKMSRDRMKLFAKEGDAGNPIEIELCKAIGAGMAAAAKGGADKSAAWDSEWINVYKLAEAVMVRVEKEGVN